MVVFCTHHSYKYLNLKLRGVTTAGGRGPIL